MPLDIPELSLAKRRLFAEPKIVIAGLSRRLEAAWDEQNEFSADYVDLRQRKMTAHRFGRRVAVVRAAANRISGIGIPAYCLFFGLETREPARGARVWPATSW